MKTNRWSVAGPCHQGNRIKLNLNVLRKFFGRNVLFGDRTRLACMARRLAGPICKHGRSNFARSVAASASRRGTTLGPSVLPENDAILMRLSDPCHPATSAVLHSCHDFRPRIPFFATSLRWSRRVSLTFLALLFLGTLPAVNLSDSQALEIGRRIWKNECAGTVSGLTSWNSGEDFASLGIGHFIWYPQGKRGPYEESFPPLAVFLAAQGVNVPAWMRGPCVWKTHREFQADQNSARMQELRKLLAATIPQQARFAAQRLERALPKMLAAAPKDERDRVKQNFQRVANQSLGYYALMDYVNFKGEGVSPSERYQGQGWGLLQVLETMPTTGDPLSGFAQAADRVLTRRVKNSPPARNEAQWLPGWRNRLKTYTQ